MRLEDLKGRDIFEQNEMILSCKKLWLDDIIDEPNLIEGKIVVFRGNYAALNANGQCVRIFEYLPEDKKWRIADMDLTKFFIEYLDTNYNAQKVREKFKFFVQCVPGFVFEK